MSALFTPTIIMAITWLVLAVAAVFGGRATPGFRPFTHSRLRVTPTDLGIGLFVGFGLFIVQIIFVALTYGLPAMGAGRPALIDGQLPAWWWVTAIIGPILIAPVLEELVFRGVLQQGLMQVFKPRLRSTPSLVPVLAIGISSLVFTLLHLLLNPGFGALEFGIVLLLSVVCGVLVQVTGRLAPAIFTHMFYNMAVVGYAQLSF